MLTLGLKVRNLNINNAFTPLFGDGGKLFDILGKLLDEYLIILSITFFRTHQVFGWSEVYVVG